MPDDKWTPGPWHRNVDAKSPVYAGDPPNHKFVAHVLGHAAEAETMANLKLIAAAPELAQALEGVLHHNAATKPEYQLPQSLVRHVKQALAKARG